MVEAIELLHEEQKYHSTSQRCHFEGDRSISIAASRGNALSANSTKFPDCHLLTDAIWLARREENILNVAHMSIRRFFGRKEVNFCCHDRLLDKVNTTKYAGEQHWKASRKRAYWVLRRTASKMIMKIPWYRCEIRLYLSINQGKILAFQDCR